MDTARLAPTAVAEDPRPVLVRAALTYRKPTRVGWLLAWVLLGVFTAGSATVVFVIEIHPAAMAAGLAMAAGYGWLTGGAFKLLTARDSEVTLDSGGLTVRFDGLLREPLRIAREELAGASIDPRDLDDRRASANVRNPGVVKPSFLDTATPVVSPHPSSHGSYGTKVMPNVVLRTKRSIETPSTPMAVRLLLRLATGKSGAYRGPKGRAFKALRLVVDDVGDLEAHLEAWGLVETLPRDERYLAPLTDADRKKDFRRRVVFAIGLSLIVGVFALLELASRGLL